MPKTLSKYDFTGQNHPENGVKAILITDTFYNSGKFLLEPYTKGFGRITHFLGNDLATVLYTAFYLELLSSNSFEYKCTKNIGSYNTKREKSELHPKSWT